MRYCPNCGKQLNQTIHIEGRDVKQCTCGFIDWDNWVNVSAVTVAYNAEGDLLMVRMKSTGKLTFPGGYRNIGESLHDAAKRECFEESGYHIDDLSLYDVFTLDRLRLVWVVFKAKIVSGSFIENDEVSETIFVSKDQWPSPSELRGSLSVGLLERLKNE